MQEYMTPYDCQKANEYTFNRKQIDKAIRKYIIEVRQDLINKGVQLLEEWLAVEYYESKQKRLNQVKVLDLTEVVIDVLVGTSYCQTPELFVSITSQLGSRLGFNNKREGITTMAEITAVVCATDYYDIRRNNNEVDELNPNSLLVQCNYALPTELMDFVANCQFIPPMIVEPEEIKSNTDAGFLTFNESVILQGDNHHEDPIALDVINTQNKVKLRLDVDFINSVDELPTFELDTPGKIRDWDVFKQKSFETYDLINEQSGELYQLHYFDKRGRMYVKGYHISSMGTPYKKAMLEFANPEIIEIPEQYK